MARFLVHSFENSSYENWYVHNGTFVARRTEIEAECFYRAIITALRYADSLTFQRNHARNSPTERVYHNGSYGFLVEKLSD